MSNKTSQSTPSFFKGFLSVFNFIKSSAATLYRWFYNPPRQYPANEAGELMRRMMIPVSWFDKISAKWNTRSFFSRASAALRAILISGAVGILWGNPLLFALAAGVVSVIVNNRLIEHEETRFRRALVLAGETIELNQQLQELSTLHENSTRETTHLTQRLLTQNEKLQTQVDRLNAEIITMQETQRRALELQTAMSALTDKTNAVNEQENALQAGCTQTQTELSRFQDAVRQATDDVGKLDNDLTTLAETARELKKSQEIFGAAVHRFSDSVDRTNTAPPSIRSSDRLFRMQAIVEASKRDNDERDQDIADFRAL
jgi:methyl-accepting chemotaxis protein